MSKDLNPEKALIFRIVHKENIRTVLSDGCFCRSYDQNGKYVEIGNSDLIAKRMTRNVPCEPYGNLSDYVPFYFTPYSPMLYNIKTGYNRIKKRPMSDVLILVSSLHKLVENEVSFVFTDRHAYLKTAQFSSDLTNLDWIIWQTLQARDFCRDDVDKFEKYQAEALVHKHMPLAGLLGVICYDDTTRTEISEIADELDATIKVVSGRKWFL